MAQAATTAGAALATSRRAPSQSLQATCTRSPSGRVHLLGLEAPALQTGLLATPLRSDRCCRVLEGQQVQSTIREGMVALEEVLPVTSHVQLDLGGRTGLLDSLLLRPALDSLRVAADRALSLHTSLSSHRTHSLLELVDLQSTPLSSLAAAEGAVCF